MVGKIEREREREREKEEEKGKRREEKCKTCIDASKRASGTE